MDTPRAEWFVTYRDRPNGRQRECGPYREKYDALIVKALLVKFAFDVATNWRFAADRVPVHVRPRGVVGRRVTCQRSSRVVRHF